MVVVVWFRVICGGVSWGRSLEGCCRIGAEQEKGEKKMGKEKWERVGVCWSALGEQVVWEAYWRVRAGNGAEVSDTGF